MQQHMLTVSSIKPSEDQRRSSGPDTRSSFPAGDTSLTSEATWSDPFLSNKNKKSKKKVQQIQLSWCCQKVRWTRTLWRESVIFSTVSLINPLWTDWCSDISSRRQDKVKDSSQSAGALINTTLYRTIVFMADVCWTLSNSPVMWFIMTSRRKRVLFWWVWRWCVIPE